MQPNIPAILACYYVDTALMAKLVAERRAETGEDIAVPAVYPGSVEDSCTECKQPVWVGPRQQTVLTTNPETKVACMRCAPLVAHAQFGDVTLRHLGNPFSGTPATS